MGTYEAEHALRTAFTAAETVPEARLRRAAAVVARHARCEAERDELLAMLGLGSPPDQGAQPPHSRLHACERDSL